MAEELLKYDPLNETSMRDAHAKAYRRYKWAIYRLRRHMKNNDWSEKERLDLHHRRAIIGADATSS